MVAARVKVVVSALERFVENVVKKLTLDIVANLLRSSSEGGTPVDTGWARANWIPSLAATASRTPAPQPSDDRATVVSAANSLASTQQLAVAGIAASYKLSQGAVNIGNSATYIVALNEGSSKKAPQAFVQAAIRRAVTVDLPAGFGV